VSDWMLIVDEEPYHIKWPLLPCGISRYFHSVMCLMYELTREFANPEYDSVTVLFAGCRNNDSRSGWPPIGCVR
jgi:hypothetical protein